MSVMILCQIECKFASLLENSVASIEFGNNCRYSFLSGLVNPLQAQELPASCQSSAGVKRSTCTSPGVLMLT